MDIRIIDKKDKNKFNSLASHPLQSWEWGEFRIKTGLEIVRLGRFEKNILAETAQLTIHPLPFSPWTIGYIPRGEVPSKGMLEKLIEVGKQNHCIFIKLEPNVIKDDPKFFVLNSKFPIVLSPHPLFTKYTFQLDLSKSDEEILKNMHPKTRYNIKVASKHNVVIKKENSPEAFDSYLRLLMETTKRQKFYAHDEKYHRLMWETLSSQGIAHLFTANLIHEGNNHILVAWILFLFNKKLYYPYGASSSEFKNVMASNLIMWETIKFGKKNNAEIFDMWGALPPTHKKDDPWIGFHKFKEGYGPKLVELSGSFDLIVNPHLYKLYNLVYTLRQIFLKIKSGF